MIENIIFYFICIFFSFIAFGAIWSHRYKHTKIFVTILVIIPAIFGLLYLSKANIASLLDIREIFSYLSYSGNQMAGRGKMLLVTILIFFIIAYFTIIICLLFQIKKRITKRCS